MQPASSWKLSRRITSHLIFAFCTGFQTMIESNTKCLLFVLVLSLLQVPSIFPIYSRRTHPLGNSNLPTTAVYCAFHLSTPSRSVKAFSYTAPALRDTLPKDIRFSQSVSSIRSALKSHLFSNMKILYWLIVWLIVWVIDCVCVCVCVCVCKCVC